MAQPRAAVHGGAAVAVGGIWLAARLVPGFEDAALFLILIPLVVAHFDRPRASCAWAMVTSVAILLSYGTSSDPARVEIAADGVALDVLALGFTLFSRRRLDAKMADLARLEAARFHEAGALTDARDRAVKASQAKSDFMATMSHEIRTALNGILGLSAVLASGRLHREQREMVGTIQASGDALRRLLDEILDTARIEAGKLELEAMVFDLGEVIEDVVDLFTAQATARGLELCTVVARPGTNAVRGDPHRVRQVVSNLVGNAVKFTREGEVVVRVWVTGGEARVEVTDSGEGMTKEQLARLFVSFEQLDPARAREHGGSGLGLSICRHFAKAMGGDVAATSDVGVGTTFSFTWPSQGSPEPPPTRESAVLKVKGERILYVDTHAAMRESVQALARSSDVLASVATSSDEGLALLAEVPHDAILLGARALDDAIALARTFRGASALPVVAVISKPTPEAEAAREGIALTAMRPLRRSRFVALVDELGGAREPAHMGSVPPPSRTCKALVVDDDPTNRRVARLLLHSLGWLTDEAASGHDALEYAGVVRYDAAFIDLHMPGIDGIETARRLRELPSPPSRLVAFTASVFDEDKQRTADAGMRDFVAKPIDVGALRGVLERIERSLRRSESKAAESDAPKTAANPADDAERIDGAVLDALLSYLGTLERRELIGDYVRSARGQVGSAREALAAADRRTLHRAVHTLASSSGTVGARSVSALARRIELAPDAPAPQIEAALDELSRELEASVRSLVRRVGDSRSDPPSHDAAEA